MSLIRSRFAFAAAASLLAAATLARADVPAAPAPEAGSRVLVSLNTGEILLGKLVSADDATVVIDHATLGRLQMPRAQVTGFTVQAPPPPTAPAPSTPPAPPKPAEAPSSPPPPPPVKIIPSPPPPPPPDPESFWEGWTHSVELGLNGSDGNSQALSLRGGFKLARETTKTVTTFDGSYNYATSDGDKTTDHGELNLRNDWRIAPPWRIYALGKAEYDQFQDWDWRVSAFGGLGYEFIKTDNPLLLGRIGAGANKEFGSSKQRIEPELDLGLDWEHKIDERQKIFATIDYYPSLHRFTDYRANAKAGYQVLVDPKNNLSLQLGVEDRYNSNPGDDKKKNDILYFATLLFSF